MANATGNNDWEARAALLTPITKVFGTEVGIDVSNLGLQVHGGMGYIEETGAAQYSRDVRVTAIYEGTNGIQSMDLVGRKLMDGGKAAKSLLDETFDTTKSYAKVEPELTELLSNAIQSLRETTDWMLLQTDLNQRFAGAVPYLRAFARVMGGFYHLSSAVNECRNGPRTKIAKFYIKNLLPEHIGLLAQATQGADDIYALDVEDLVA